MRSDIILRINCTGVHLISYLFALIILLLAGCSGKYPEAPPSDPELLIYSEDIRSESPVELEINYSIYFDTNSELTGNQIGICRFANHRPFSIIISRQYWEQASELGRYALLTHEIVHCSLSMGHIKEGESEEGRLMARNIPDSILCIFKLGISGCIQQSIDLANMGLIEPALGLESHKH